MRPTITSLSVLTGLVLSSVCAASLATQTSFAAVSEDKADHDDRDAEAKRQLAPTLVVEAKPLIDFSALSSHVPGGLGLALGGESQLSGKWYAVGETSFWSLNRSTENVKDLKDDQDDDDNDLIAKHRRAGALLIGVRRYSRPAGNSWYGGGMTGYMSTNSTYVVGDAEIQDKASGLPLLIEGGYRWVWDNNLSLRVGGRGGKSVLFSRDVTTTRGEDSDKAKHKVKREDPEFSPSFEVAVGYAL